MTSFLNYLLTCFKNKEPKLLSAKRNYLLLSMVANKILIASSKDSPLSLMMRFSSSTPLTFTSPVLMSWRYTPKSLSDITNCIPWAPRQKVKSHYSLHNKCHSLSIILCFSPRFRIYAMINKKNCFWNLPWKVKFWDAMHRLNWLMDLTFKI